MSDKNNLLQLYNGKILRNVIMGISIANLAFLFIFLLRLDLWLPFLIFVIFVNLCAGIIFIYYFFTMYYYLYLADDKILVFKNITGQSCSYPINDLVKIEKRYYGKVNFYFKDRKVPFLHDNKRDKKVFKEVISKIKQLKNKGEEIIIKYR